jgi:hypothetical protein
MKQTVQIVTIPTKELTNLFISVDTKETKLVTTTKKYEGDKLIPQQLLVLSDDGIQENNSFLDSFGKIDTFNSGEFKPNKACKKIIASYPRIEGTLPISKETIQAWIDAGTPEEGFVELVEKDVAQYQDTDGCSFGYTLTELETDSYSNLLLEFSKEITRSMQGYNYGDFEDETKLSIPTDEEINRICVRGFTTLS